MERIFVKYFIIPASLICSCLSTYSQSNIDSLENLIGSNPNKEKRLELLIAVSDEYALVDLDKSLSFSKSGLKLSEELNDTLRQLECIYQISYAQLELGNYEESIKGFQDQEILSQKFKNSEYEAKAYYGLGLVNYYLDYRDKALEFWEKELLVEKRMNDKLGIAITLSNLSGVLVNTGEVEKSLSYDKEALSIYKEINDRDGIASALYNIAATYISQEKYNEALIYSKESLRINKELDDWKSTGLSYSNIARIFSSLKDYETSNKYVDSSIIFVDKLESKFELERGYKSASLILYSNKEFEKAYDLNIKYQSIRDSLYQIENRSMVTEMNTKYETEKKEKANELLRKQGEIDTLEISSQRKQRVYLFTGLGLTFILLIIIFNRFKNSQRQKKLIEKQKEEVELQKELIEEKSTEITDSINYAQRIQQALLKSEEHVSNHFPPHFILLKPKDIVSGDFYWAIEKHGCLYISVADCTGHGVPGAFMSMLGIAFLNEINSSEKMFSPAEILDELRNRVIRELSQTGSLEGSKDGMDMCIIKLDKNQKEIEWAGANNPLYIVNGKEVKEIRADRQPVAFSDFAKPFTNHSFTISEPSCLYMFSDGYVDQFGGPKGKKFKSKNYKELLMRFNKEEMDVQKEQLNKAFEDWRGDLEQIDDVCIVGIRL